MVLGGIVVAFLLMFFSLAQDVRVSATTYDIDRLQAERDRLLAQEQEIRSDLDRLGQEPAIRKLSIDAGLTQLGEPLVLPAAEASIDRCSDGTDSRIRLLALLVVFVVASLALVSRLAFWQIVERDWLLERALAQTTVRLETPSRRGSIYDRSGTVALASTVDARPAGSRPEPDDGRGARADRHGSRRHAWPRRRCRRDASREPRHGPRLHRHSRATSCPPRRSGSGPRLRTAGSPT
jgi:hypothetical protein